MERNISKNMQMSRIKGLFLSALLVVIGFIFGYTYTSTQNGQLDLTKANPINIDFIRINSDVHKKVYSILKQRYVDENKLDDQNMYYGLIKGLVASLDDPATVFMDPEEYTEYKKALSGEYEGIGALLEQRESNTVVVSVFDGSPAQQASLRAGDVIIKVNDQNVTGYSIVDVVKKIRGPAGTKVKLTVYRNNGEGKIVELEIARDKIDAPSARIAEIKDGVLVLRLSKFSDDSLQDWLLEISGIMHNVGQDIDSGKVKGIILDLRGNPGGFLEGAIDFVSYFLPKGTPVTYRKGRDGIEAVYTTKDMGQDTIDANIPVVVLVNNGSASASEIVAGALQYYKRAFLIGEPTFGKATVQDSTEFEDGSYVKYTIAYWTLPNKESITHENPVKPDKEVKFDSKLKLEKGVDNQLQTAFEYLNKIIN